MPDDTALDRAATALQEVGRAHVQGMTVPELRQVLDRIGVPGAQVVLHGVVRVEQRATPPSRPAP